MSPRGLRAWCHALPRMRASSLPASPLPVCSRTGRAPRPRRALPGVIGALGRGRERGNAVKGNVEYRSRAAARICRESPLTEWSATLAREGNGRPFPSAPRRVRGLVRRGQRPLPAIGFWGCRPAALFFQKGRRGLGNRCRHRSGQRPGQGGSRPDAQRACERRALRRSTRLYEVKGSVLPFISKEAIV